MYFIVFYVMCYLYVALCLFKIDIIDAIIVRESPIPTSIATEPTGPLSRYCFDHLILSVYCIAIGFYCDQATEQAIIINFWSIRLCLINNVHGFV